MLSLRLFAYFLYAAGIISLAVYRMRNKNARQFFLANRKLTGLSMAVSVQTTTFGGYLLMGIPGAIYAYGANRAFVAVGLFIASILSWAIIPERLRDFSVAFGDVITVPQYLKNRFGDNKNILKLISAMIIIFSLVVFEIAIFISLGKVFSYVTRFSFKEALIMCGIVIMFYTMLSGLRGVCEINFVQGSFVLIGVVSISLIAVLFMGRGYIIPNLVHSGLNSSAVDFLDVFKTNGQATSHKNIFIQLSWGLGMFGLPQIMTSYMAAANRNEIKKSKRVGIVWAFFALVTACIMGVIGRAYLYPNVLTSADRATENVFIEMVKKAFVEETYNPFVVGLLMCSIVSAIMAALDSVILSISSTITNDIIKDMIAPKIREKYVVFIGRIIIVVITVIGGILASNANCDINMFTNDCWVVLGCSMGPVIIVSLYWKRMNKYGALAGLVAGVIAPMMWSYIRIFENNQEKVSFEAHTGISSMMLGFVSSIVAIVTVSLLTKDINEDVKKIFTNAKNRNIE